MHSGTVMHSYSAESNYMEINMEIIPYQTFYLNRDEGNGKDAHDAPFLHSFNEWENNTTEHINNIINFLLLF